MEFIQNEQHESTLPTSEDEEARDEGGDAVAEDIMMPESVVEDASEHVSSNLNSPFPKVPPTETLSPSASSKTTLSFPAFLSPLGSSCQR